MIRNFLANDRMIKFLLDEKSEAQELKVINEDYYYELVQLIVIRNQDIQDMYFGDSNLGIGTGLESTKRTERTKWYSSKEYDFSQLENELEFYNSIFNSFEKIDNFTDLNLQKI